MGKIRVIPANHQRKPDQHSENSSEPSQLKVAAYCRVSTDFEEQASSYETQVNHYKELINNRPDWTSAGIYADDGISGTNTKKREQFNQMISAAKAGKIDMVVTKSISRFARNTVDCLKYVRLLKDLNVAVYFEKENINTLDAKGEVMITIMASLAQQESESLSRNVKLGFQYRFQQGKVMVNHNHFLGYTKDDQGNLVIDPEQAKTVRRIYRSYLEGMTTNQIAKQLTAEGIKNGANRTRWHASNVTQILRNEKYIGDALLQKTYTVDFLSKKRIKNDGRVPQYYVENSHPAIISKPVYYQVQQILDKSRDGFTTANGRHHQYSRKYCFSSIVFCSHCADVYTRVTRFSPTKYGVWGCSAHIRQRRKRSRGRPCEGRFIKESKLQQKCIAAFNELIAQHQLAEKQIIKNIVKVIQETDGPTLTELEQQLEQQQQELLAKANQGHDVTLLSEQIQTLREQRDSLIQQEINQNIREDSLMKIQALFKQHPQGITVFDEKMVRHLVEKIIINDYSIDFYFKDGEKIRINN